MKEQTEKLDGLIITAFTRARKETLDAGVSNITQSLLFQEFLKRYMKEACKEAGLKFVNWHNAEFKEESGEVICEEQYKIEEIE